MLNQIVLVGRIKEFNHILIPGTSLTLEIESQDQVVESSIYINEKLFANKLVYDNLKEGSLIGVKGKIKNNDYDKSIYIYAEKLTFLEV